LQGVPAVTHRQPSGGLPYLGAFVKEDVARWAKLVKETGAKVE